MAGNRWLRERIPRTRAARKAVRRFMPGDEAEAGTRRGRDLRGDGIASLFTRLGENVEDRAAADAVADHYLGLLGDIRERGLDGEVSVKLTQLGMDLDDDVLVRALRPPRAAGHRGRR